jgi:hypothetical protein
MALPISDPEVQDFYAVCGYYETFGLFYAKAIVDRDLVLEWLDFVGPWERACAIALAQREAQRFDGLWEHFEGLAMAQRLWFESRAVAAGP